MKPMYLEGSRWWDADVALKMQPLRLGGTKPQPAAGRPAGPRNTPRRSLANHWLYVQRVRHDPRMGPSLLLYHRRISGGILLPPSAGPGGPRRFVLATGSTPHHSIQDRAFVLTHKQYDTSLGWRRPRVRGGDELAF